MSARKTQHIRTLTARAQRTGRWLLLMCLTALITYGCSEQTTQPRTVASIQVTIEAPVLFVGTTTRATAKVLDQSGTELTDAVITWRSSNDSIATIDARGNVTPLARGNATILASVASATGEASLSVRAVFTVRSYTLPLSLVGVSSSEAPIAFNSLVAPLAYAAIGGAEHLIFNPSFGQRGPELPVHHFIKQQGAWRLERTYDDVRMGAARDHAFISNQSAIVFADHGLELETGFETWTYGDIWSARISGAGLQWTRLSNVKAFNHSLAQGDLNGDGLSDFVVLNMGTRPQGNSCSYLQVFLQQPNLTFTQDSAAFSCLGPFATGSGAVTVADIDGDGHPEIIEADYVNNSSFDAPIAFNFYGRDSIVSGRPFFSHRRTINRSGVFANSNYGATRIYARDMNGDSHIDLVVALENHLSGFDNTIDVWFGDGRGQFTNSGINLAPPPNQVMMREFEVADVNKDGKPDLLLNSWNPVWWDASSQMADLTNLIWLNQGTTFRRPNQLRVRIPMSRDFFVRWFAVDGAVKGIFLSLDDTGVLHITELQFWEDLQ